MREIRYSDPSLCVSWIQVPLGAKYDRMSYELQKTLSRVNEENRLTYICCIVQAHS